MAFISKLVKLGLMKFRLICWTTQGMTFSVCKGKDCLGPISWHHQGPRSATTTTGPPPPQPPQPTWPKVPLLADTWGPLAANTLAQLGPITETNLFTTGTARVPGYHPATTTQDLHSQYALIWAVTTLFTGPADNNAHNLITKQHKHHRVHPNSQLSAFTKYPGFLCVTIAIMDWADARKAKGCLKR